MKLSCFLIVLLFNLSAWGQASVIYFGEYITDPVRSCDDGRLIQMGPYRLQDFTSYRGVDLSGVSMTPEAQIIINKGEYISEAYIFGGIMTLSKRTQVCLGINNTRMTCVDSSSNLSKNFYFKSNFCDSNSGCKSPVSSSMDGKKLRASMGFFGDEDIGNGNRIDFSTFADPSVNLLGLYYGRVLSILCVRQL